MTGLLRRPQNLVDLGRCHILGKHAADTFSIQMDLEHDLRRRGTILVEELLYHRHYEFHRSVIIIEYHDLVHLRWLDLARQTFQNDRCAIISQR